MKSFKRAFSVQRSAGKPIEGIGLVVAREGREERLEAKAKQGVVGTLPERIVWLWLELSGQVFEVQKQLMGGAGLVGSSRADFVVYFLLGRPVVLRVQGAYWHGPDMMRGGVDDEQAARLRGVGYVVVDLWEEGIYEAALAGRVEGFVMGEVYGQG